MKQPQPKSPGKQAAILLLPLVLGGILATPVAYLRSGTPGLWAVAAAWSTCFLSGLLAWWLVQRFNGPHQALQQVLLGTLVRMSLPLIVVFVANQHGGILAKAGIVYYILTFYLITLAAETVVLAGTLSQAPTESRTS